MVSVSTQVGKVGVAREGNYPVSFTFPSLGEDRYQDDTQHNLTYLLVVSSFSPLSGSTAGKQAPTGNHTHFLFLSPPV